MIADTTYKKLLSIVVLFVMLILGAIGILMAANVNYNISHAVAKHGSDALTVRSCMSGNETMWIMPNTTYKARFCDLGDGRHGVQILKEINGKLEEVTAFIRKSGPNSASIQEYLVESGYVNPTWLGAP